MTDISDRLMKTSSVKRDGGEYDLVFNHFIPYLGIVRYNADCPLDIKDKTFFKRFSIEEIEDILDKRTGRVVGLIVYNALVTCAGLVSATHFLETYVF